MGVVVHLPIVSVWLPRTRGDCAPGGRAHVRPCPWRECKWHVERLSDGAHVREVDEGIERLASGELDEDGQPILETCVLDVADSGGASLDDVGKFAGVTRERIRQIECKAEGKILRRAQLGQGAPSDLLEHHGGVIDLEHREGPRGQSMRTRAAQMPVVDSGEDTLDEDGNERQWVPRLPHILDESVSDEQYAGAIYDALLRREAARAAESRGDYVNLRGTYVSKRAVQAYQAIEALGERLGHGPTMMEIADALGETDGTEASVVTAMSNLVSSLREAGLVTGRTGTLRLTTDEELAQAKVEAMAPPPPPASTVRTHNQQEGEAMNHAGAYSATAVRLDIIDMLRKEGPLRPGQLKERLGCSPATLQRAGSSLIKDGTLERRGIHSRCVWLIKGDNRVGDSETAADAAKPSTRVRETESRAAKLARSVRAAPPPPAIPEAAPSAPSTALAVPQAASYVMAPATDGESPAVRILRRERDALMVQVAQLDSAIDKLTA